MAARSPRVRATGRTFGYLLHAGEPEIAISQNDIRAIQLAKAALYAGARLLMDRLGVEQVGRVTLAGAFGSHIDPIYAMVLGMIPDCPLDKVGSAGNAAGTGARIALLNRKARAEIEAVVERIEKVETAIEPRFQEHFVAAMAIPHKTAPYPNLAAAVTLPAAKEAWRAARAGGADEPSEAERARSASTTAISPMASSGANATRKPDRPRSGMVVIQRAPMPPKRRVRTTQTFGEWPNRPSRAPTL